MERLLNAIASNMKVRFNVENQTESLMEGVTVKFKMFDYKEVSEEVKETFKKELKRDLFYKLKELEVGEDVEYGFDYGNVRPLGKIMEDANDNLAELLLKLPSLKEGERYTFPCDTYICFTLTGKEKDEITVRPTAVSDRIMESYEKAEK